MATQAKEEWEKAMTELAQEEPELLQHFQKLSEAAGKVGKADNSQCLWFWCVPLLAVPVAWILCVCVCVFCIGTDTASQQEFTSCLKETLRGLAKNADNLQVGKVRLNQLLRNFSEQCKHRAVSNGIVLLQSTGLAGDDLVKALEGLGLEEGGEGGGDEGNILPIMQSIMQNLLSKEVLYPSLKEITAKVCICFFSIFYHVVCSSATKWVSSMSLTLTVPRMVGFQQAKPQSGGLPALWAAGQNHGRDLHPLWEGGTGGSR